MQRRVKLGHLRYKRRRVHKSKSWCRDGGSGCASGSRDGDEVHVVRVSGTIYVVARRKEGIKPLYEAGVSVKEHGDAFDDAWCVDPEKRLVKEPFGGSDEGKRPVLNETMT